VILNRYPLPRNYSAAFITQKLHQTRTCAASEQQSL